MTSVALALLSARAEAAVPFPQESEWVPLVRAQLPIEDPLGDAGDAPELDAVGVPDTSVADWTADDQTFFLRMRVAGQPTGAGTWGFLLSVDGNDDNWEAALTVEGPGVLLGSTNPTGAFGLQPPRVVADPRGYGSRATGEVRTVAAGEQAWLEIQIPRAALETDLGVLRSGPLRIAAITGTRFDAPLADVAGCDGGAGPCTALAPVLADEIRIDFDADGLTWPQEIALGTDPEDADSDDDGALDGDERDDANADGVPDALACDTDGDGLPDGLERGVGTPLPATDLSAGCFLPDTDPSTTTDPALADTDGGGRSDGAEDADHDGAVDAWETDPSAAADEEDQDGDGVPDLLDDRLGTGDDSDSDGDGIGDPVERLADTDGDGVPDFADLDSDGDGWSDAEEGVADGDSDGLGDWRDPDSDGDGLPDLLEPHEDHDDDGLVDRLDPDGDGDGLTDGLDPDLWSTDADGDGIEDGVEGAGDTDGDGVPDVLDDDSDGDGWSDAVEADFDGDGVIDDTDGDDVPDFQDTDSDGDGRDDAVEGADDADCDGLPDRLDADGEDSFCDTAAVPTVDTAASPPDPVRGPVDPFAAPGGFTGGGCDTSGAPAVGWLAALALALTRRRRRAAGLALVVPGLASAQDAVNADRFAPSVDGGELVVTESVGERSRAGAAGWLDHADDPLVYRPDVGDPIPVLHAVSTVRLLAYVRAGRFRVGGEVPLHASVAGLDVQDPTVPGDLRLSTETLVASVHRASFGLLADLALPTGDPEAWLGAGRVVAHASAAGTVDTGDWLVSANLGGRTGTGQALGDLRVGPALTGAAGVARRLPEGLSLAAEASGELWWEDLGQEGAVPVEGLLSARKTVGGVGAMSLAGGAGLTRGLGSPDLRLALGLSWWLGARPAG